MAANIFVMKSRLQHEKDIVEVIKKNKVCVIQHIFAYYTELKSSQFYNLELEKSEIIKEAIANNKAKGCIVLLNKMINSDNPTLNLAAYRLICTPEERQNLNQSYIDHTSGGEKLTTPPVQIIMDGEEIKLQ